MNDIVPNAIVRAAEARVQGAGWTATAMAAGWSLDGLRYWVRKHARAWACELGRARRDARDAACDEAVTILRKQLRGEEAKTILLAAVALAKQFAEKHKKPPPANGNVEGELFRLLEAVPDDRVTRLDAHLQACEEEAAATASYHQKDHHMNTS